MSAVMSAVMSTPTGAAVRPGPESAAALLLRQLGEGLRQDLAAYDGLRQLLDQQFNAALQHDAARMSGLADDILTQVAALDVQRARRRELLVALLGSAIEPSVRALLQRLPASLAQPLAVQWRALEQALTSCKALNLRNCELITEQQALMQQLLGREEHVYAQR
ncbi:flagellar protein FlgN [Roseateles sp. SL47]|uniref:flagellar protein FlgN n=1 Tax=Roseateles sp. SL47 TaxID=2995138 RepID=UPI00226E0C05|nr:flagellar protein FlgN [Roseateles sp. SL47]WAC75548.1 flagellar protein FlgN [Roseateles sp. SL47]